jgi:flagellar basal-body rod modification protein FlgD
MSGPASGPGSTTGGTSGSSSTSDSSTISANDFLTLLVTEMQNQDPTADTDPNEYIDQLVQVNSLEQLIDINQNLSTALGTSTTGTSSSSTSSSTSGAATPASAVSSVKAASGITVQGQGAPQKGRALQGIQSFAASASNQGVAAAKRAPGNLSVPEDKPAAHRVAHSLAGHPRTQ